MTNNKLSAEQRVQKEHVWLMKSTKYCMYSGVIMIGKTEVRDDLPTACTNGRDTAYGRVFVEKQDSKTLRGLILHENLHKAFRHTTVWRHLYKKDALLANRACDYVINLMIHDSDPTGQDVRLPEGGCLDEKYRGLDAGEVFRQLQQQQQQQQQNGQGQEGFDDHDWDGADAMSDTEKEQLARDVDQALRQGALLASKLNGNMPREVSELLKPKVDWREALREFITSFCQDKDVSTWRRPSRRWIGQDVYMPSTVGESVGRIVVAVDMSGSIGPEQIGKFLSELQSICKMVVPEGIDLLYWDTNVRQHEKYERDNDGLDNLLASTKPRGGGGTDPQCVVDYIEAKNIAPECVVVLTDGYVSSWGKGWAWPVLWGITTERLTATVGKTVPVK